MKGQATKVSKSSSRQKRIYKKYSLETRLKIIDKVLGAKKSIAEVSREFRMPQATARLIINLFKETGRVFEKKSEVETREDEKTEMIQEYYRRLATYREVQGDRVSESHEEPQQVPQSAQEEQQPRYDSNLTFYTQTIFGPIMQMYPYMANSFSLERFFYSYPLLPSQLSQQ